MSNRLNNEQFLEKLKELHIQSVPLEEYQAAKTKIKFLCPCGNVFYRTPDKMYQSSGLCEACSTKDKATHKKQSSKELFLKQLNKIRPSLRIRGDFNGLTFPLELECVECKNIWRVNTAREVLKNNNSTTGCPFCNSRIVSTSYNFYEYNKLIVTNIQEPKDFLQKISPFSRKQVTIKCPNCGYVYQTSALYISKFGIKCKMCTDRVSFPNKVLRSLILYCADKLDWYSFEWNSKWLGKQRVDCLIQVDGTKYAIEMQGGQHYGGYDTFWGQTKEEIKQLDETKRQLLKYHDIYEIEIDCKTSDFNYIKNNIINSRLFDYLGLANVDWDVIYQNSLKSLVVEACQLYNITQSVLDVSERMKISTSTIRNYLRIGKEANLVSVPKEHNCPFCKKQIDNPGGLAVHIKYCKLRHNESFKT